MRRSRPLTYRTTPAANSLDVQCLVRLLARIVTETVRRSAVHDDLTSAPTCGYRGTSSTRVKADSGQATCRSAS